MSMSVVCATWKQALRRRSKTSVRIATSTGAPSAAGWATRAAITSRHTKSARGIRMNVVEIDTSEKPTRLHFSTRFNAAVPFIDRHLAQGRGDRVAVRTTHADITYSELAANVDRCAAGLMRLGLRPAERLLMVVKDCPAFFYLFWGAIKAGIVPVPLNTLLLRDTYSFMIEDSGAAALVYSPEFAGEVEAAVAAAR